MIKKIWHYLVSSIPFRLALAGVAIGVGIIFALIVTYFWFHDELMLFPTVLSFSITNLFFSFFYYNVVYLGNRE